jgi:hypothetical protein
MATGEAGLKERLMIYGTGGATRQVAIWLHGERPSSFSGCSETALSAAGLSLQISAEVEDRNVGLLEVLRTDQVIE